MGVPLNVKNEFRRSKLKSSSRFLKWAITFLIHPLLRKLGYSNPRRAPHDFPKSHYYSSTTQWDHIVGLHSLPYSRAWLDSKRENLSMKDGEFVPWITYPALDFMEKLPLHLWSVLEFGSGASTLWFQKRSKIFQSYEFDAGYIGEISKFIKSPHRHIVDGTNFPQNSDEENLVEGLDQLLANDKKLNDFNPQFWKEFNPVLFQNSVFGGIESADLIFIDGGPRNFLIGLACTAGKPDVVIVLDNSDMECFAPGINTLKSSGFVEFPFSGPGPLNPYNWQTSIFIKSLNPLRR